MAAWTHVYARACVSNCVSMWMTEGVDADLCRQGSVNGPCTHLLAQREHLRVLCIHAVEVTHDGGDGAGSNVFPHDWHAPLAQQLGHVQLARHQEQHRSALLAKSRTSPLFYEYVRVKV